MKRHLGAIIVLAFTICTPAGAAIIKLLANETVSLHYTIALAIVGALGGMFIGHQWIPLMRKLLRPFLY